MSDKDTKSYNNVQIDMDGNRRLDANRLMELPQPRGNIVRYAQNSSNFPNNREGVALTMYYDGATRKGFQLAVDEDGKLFTRCNKNGDSSWKPISGDTKNNDNVIIKPEKQGHVTNVDDITTTSIRRTSESGTTGGTLPNGVTGESKVGILHTYSESSTASWCYQIYISIRGRMKGKQWIRVRNNSWGPWSEIGSQSVDLSPFMKKPESDVIVPNVGDVLKESGIRKTGNTTLGLPRELGEQDRWGVVQTFIENPNTSNHKATGFQLFAPIDNKAFGKLFFRAFNDNVDDKKRTEDSWKVIDMHSLSNTFGHHSTPHDGDINTFDKAGYYHTNDQTLNLPKGVNKTGILKVLIDSNGRKYFTYTPLDGPEKGHTWEASKGHTRNLTEDEWRKVNEDKGHVKIIDTRQQSVPKPSEYKASSSPQSGFVMYEWKWVDSAGNNGIRPPAGEGSTQGGRCILCTFEPEGSQVGGSDYSDVCQIAHFKSGNSYIRHGQNGTDGWEAWRALSGGGGTTVTGPDFTQWYN